MKPRFIAFFASLSLLFSCQGQPSDKAKTITPAEYSQALSQHKNAQLLDVRTSEEFSRGHLDKAQNLDWYEKDAFAAKASKLDKSKPVFVYCAAGARSKKAADKLSEMGFSQVYDLQGGYVKWSAQGFGDSGNGNDKGIGMSLKEYDGLIKSGEKVLVNFFAPWCEPCKKMEPYLVKMVQERQDIKIVRLNTDGNKTLMKDLKIDGLPRLILYVKGKETWKHDGFISEEDLKTHL